jgi:hypothetical protein
MLPRERHRLLVDAELLMVSEDVPNQAFRAGPPQGLAHGRDEE